MGQTSRIRNHSLFIPTDILKDESIVASTSKIPYPSHPKPNRAELVLLCSSSLDTTLFTVNLCQSYRRETLHASTKRHHRIHSYSAIYRHPVFYGLESAAKTTRHCLWYGTESKEATGIAELDRQSPDSHVKGSFSWRTSE